MEKFKFCDVKSARDRNFENQTRPLPASAVVVEGSVAGAGAGGAETFTIPLPM
jgi:hypothetical protein